MTAPVVLSRLPHRRLFLAGAASLIAGCGNPLESRKPTSVPVPPATSDSPAQPVYTGPMPADLLAKHLETCETNCQSAVSLAVKPLSHAFAVARNNTEGFAGAALSLRSSYYLLVDQIPYLTNQNWLETHLNNKFSYYFFSAEDLETALETGVQKFVAKLEEEENRLLVNLRADIEGLPEAVRPQMDLDQLKARYEAALNNAQEVSIAKGKDVIVDHVVVMVAGEVLRRVLRRLLGTAIRRILTSLGLRGVCTAGGGLLGGPLGFTGGLVLDYMISSIIDWWNDPRGALAEKLDSDLRTMEVMLLDGDDENEGIRSVLGQVLKARANQRAKLLNDLILENR